MHAVFVILCLLFILFLILHVKKIDRTALFPLTALAVAIIGCVIYFKTYGW